MCIAHTILRGSSPTSAQSVQKPKQRSTQFPHFYTPILQWRATCCIAMPGKAIVTTALQISLGQSQPGAQWPVQKIVRTWLKSQEITTNFLTLLCIAQRGSSICPLPDGSDPHHISYVQAAYVQAAYVQASRRLMSRRLMSRQISGSQSLPSGLHRAVCPSRHAGLTAGAMPKNGSDRHAPPFPAPESQLPLAPKTLLHSEQIALGGPRARARASLAFVTLSQRPHALGRRRCRPPWAAHD